MIVSFVNNKRGHSAQTSSLLAASIMLAGEEDKRVLLVHTGTSSLSLETALLGRQKPDIGIDEFKRAFMQKELSEDEVLSYCYSFMNGKLFLLSGTKAKNGEIFEEIMQCLFPLILSKLRGYFDYIFIDIENNNGAMSKELINSSDSMIVLISQSPEELKEAGELRREYKKKNNLWIVGRYDKKSRFDLGYMRRNLSSGISLAAIPYCSGFMDAMYKGRVIEFFEINMRAGIRDINYEFIKGVRNTKNKLLLALKGEKNAERM